MNNLRLMQTLCALLSISLFACSGGDLSRSKATEQIKTKLEKQPITHSISLGDENGKIIYTYSHITYYNTDHKNYEYGKKFVEDYNKYIALSEKGLINYKVLKLKQDDGYKRSKGDPSRFYEDWFELNLTQKAKEYVLNEKVESGWGNKQKIAIVKLANLDEVEVTGLTAPSDAFGQKMCQANFTATYKLTPFGEVFKDNVKTVQQGSATFILYDDGWRLSN